MQEAHILLVEDNEGDILLTLDAFEESSHWVLVLPLQPELLPFKRLRLTTAELAETAFCKKKRFMPLYCCSRKNTLATRIKVQH